MDLFLWLLTVIDARLGAAVLAVRFFVDSKPKNNATPDLVDCACQTDPEEVGKELEGEPDVSVEDMEQEGVQASDQKTKGVSPYVWDYAYWPSEGGV